jgi:hypothetical protein
VLVQLSTDIDSRRLYSLEEHLYPRKEVGDKERKGQQDCNEKLTCYSRLFDIDEVRLEHAFGCFESFRADFDRSAIG